MFFRLARERVTAEREAFNNKEKPATLSCGHQHLPRPPWPAPLSHKLTTTPRTQKTVIGARTFPCRQPHHRRGRHQERPFSLHSPSPPSPCRFRAGRARRASLRRFLPRRSALRENEDNASRVSVSVASG